MEKNHAIPFCAALDRRENAIPPSYEPKSRPLSPAETYQPLVLPDAAT